jgi:hypothetical protein
MLMLMVIIHVSSFHLGVDMGVPVLEMALAEGERQTEEEEIHHHARFGLRILLSRLSIALVA